jgi:hypothetical protein
MMGDTNESFGRLWLRKTKEKMAEEWATRSVEGIKAQQQAPATGARPTPEQANSEGVSAAWDGLSPDGKRAAWNAMTPAQRREKAVELVKKHNGNKTAAGAEVVISRERMGTLFREGTAEQQPEAPLPDNHWIRDAGLAEPKQGKPSR